MILRYFNNEIIIYIRSILFVNIQYYLVSKIIYAFDGAVKFGPEPKLFRGTNFSQPKLVPQPKLVRGTNFSRSELVPWTKLAAKTSLLFPFLFLVLYPVSCAATKNPSLDAVVNMYGSDLP